MILISWQIRPIRISLFDPMKPFCYHSFDLRQLVSFAEIANTPIRYSFETRERRIDAFHRGGPRALAAVVMVAIIYMYIIVLH